MSDEEHISKLEAGLEQVRLATASQVQAMEDLVRNFEARSEDDQAHHPATQGMYFELASWLAESLSAIAQNNLALTDMSVSLAKLVTSRTRNDPPDVDPADSWKFGVVRPDDEDNGD